jgi:hypothetical protein
VELQALIDALRGGIKARVQDFRDLPDTTADRWKAALLEKKPFQPLTEKDVDTALNFLGTGIISGVKAFPELVKGAAQAYKLRAAGKRPAEISEATQGWYVGPEGIAKREISDAPMQLLPFAERELKTSGIAGEELSGYLKHPELFKRYPEMADIKVSGEINPFANSRGQYNPSTREIEVVAPDARSWKSVLGHELQHDVQAAERFDPGANLSNIFEALKAKHPDVNPAILSKEATKLYLRNMGEAEARMVEGKIYRGDFGAHPLEAYDTAIIDLLRRHQLPK